MPIGAGRCYGTSMQSTTQQPGEPFPALQGGEMVMYKLASIITLIAIALATLVVTSAPL